MYVNQACVQGDGRHVRPRGASSLGLDVVGVRGGRAQPGVVHLAAAASMQAGGRRDPRHLGHDRGDRHRARRPQHGLERADHRLGLPVRLRDRGAGPTCSTRRHRHAPLRHGRQPLLTRSTRARMRARGRAGDDRRTDLEGFVAYGRALALRRDARPGRREPDSRVVRRRRRDDQRLRHRHPPADQLRRRANHVGARAAFPACAATATTRGSRQGPPSAAF